LPAICGPNLSAHFPTLNPTLDATLWPTLQSTVFKTIHTAYFAAIKLSLAAAFNAAICTTFSTAFNEPLRTAISAAFGAAQLTTERLSFDATVYAAECKTILSALSTAFEHALVYSHDQSNNYSYMPAFSAAQFTTERLSFDATVYAAECKTINSTN